MIKLLVASREILSRSHENEIGMDNRLIPRNPVDFSSLALTMFLHDRH